jgi:hypothetical protein
MSPEAAHELLYQALETEKGGIQVYRTALRCVINGLIIGVVAKFLMPGRDPGGFIITTALRSMRIDSRTVTERIKEGLQAAAPDAARPSPSARGREGTANAIGRP